MSHTTTIWINGRFLDRPITGVERVARELLSVLALQLDEAGCMTLPKAGHVQFKLVAPPLTAEQTESAKTKDQSCASPWSSIRLERIGKRSGHLWEQSELLMHTRGQWLLGLCNTAPLLKPKQILFLHDAQCFVIPENFTTSFRLWYHLVLRVTGRIAKAILTNSASSARDLARYGGLGSERIHVLHLGGDHLSRLQADESIITQHNIRPPFLLAVASLNRNKNFASVVKALEILQTDHPEQPLRCVIAGQRYDKVFQSQALSNPGITHVGYVSDAQLLALYGHATCLLFPSLYEGFGLPPIEAMREGCTVIASHTASLPEVCGDAALYCDPYDPKTLASQIHKLMSDPTLQKSLQEKGKIQARQFTWKAMAEQFLMVLDDTLAASPTRQSVPSAVGERL